MKNLKGKYFWLVGASSGIGLALAKQLAAEGAIVAVSARRDEPLTEIVNGLDGDEHLAVPVDVTNLNKIDSAIKTITDKWSRIDSMIFLAATYASDQDTQNDLNFIKTSYDVNVFGMFNIKDRLLPIYKKQGHGEFVFTASVAGFRGLPNGQPYSSTKAAIINYTESLKVELEGDNINVRMICPGFVKTDMTAKNEFEMPMAIETDEAAHYIIKGLKRGDFEIHFPKQFTYIMKLLDILPRPLYFMLSRKMFEKSQKSS